MNIRAPGHTRVTPLETAVHQFTVGQIVRIRSKSGVFPKTDDVFRITRTLPIQDNFPQYRLRNDGESYERVAAEDALELVGAELAGRADAAGVGTGWTSTRVLTAAVKAGTRGAARQDPQVAQPNVGDCFSDSSAFAGRASEGESVFIWPRRPRSPWRRRRRDILRRSSHPSAQSRSSPTQQALIV